ncbi:MAG: hypothetical protein ACRDKE_08380, partial [Solirubrobacterales bacterium]
MRRSRLPLLLCLLAYLAFAAPVRAAVPNYQFVDLGLNFKPTAINDQRQIVGFFGAFSQGAWWNDGVPQYFSSLETSPTPSAATASPLDINNSGVVVGEAWSDTTTKATWWQYGSATAHLAGVALGDRSRDRAINALGSMVGTSHTITANSERVQITAAGSSTATTVANESVRAEGCGIADDGEILISKNGAFGVVPNALAATITPLTGFTGGCFGHPMAADGTIVGKDSNGLLALRNPDNNGITPLELAIPPGITYGTRSVNAGIVVGTQSEAGEQTAYGYYDGAKILLNTLLPAGFYSQDAADVNVNGDVVGWYRDWSPGNSGEVHGFLLKNSSVTPPGNPDPPATA